MYPCVGFLFDKAHRGTPPLAARRTGDGHAVIEQLEHDLGRQGEIIVYAEEPLEVGAAEHVTQDFLRLGDNRGEGVVLLAAADDVLRTVFRQLLRGRELDFLLPFRARQFRGRGRGGDGSRADEPHAQELFMRGLNFAHRAAKLARRTLKVAARALQVYVQQGNVPVMRGDKPVRRRLRYKIFRCALLHSLKSS